MNRKFEEQLAYCCACTLEGVKPASMLACPKIWFDDIHEIIDMYKDMLQKRNLTIEILCEKKTIWLLYLYDKEKVEELMENDEIHSFLEPYGYTKDLTFNLEHLRDRFAYHVCPHEVGVFLGYPLEDIEGFIKYEGKEFKLNGPWKVYKNENEKKDLFASYKRITTTWIEAHHDRRFESKIMQIGGM